MGSFLSSWSKGGDALAAEGEEVGQAAVVAFHSMDGWNSHWELHKAQPNQLMVVDFSATWCGPCRFMEPVFKEVAAKWTVEAMPTFVLIKGGREVDRVVGAAKAELESKIQRQLSSK
ncbi:unnamed protein product [Spirodela intermedia]|uniref:Thioredoxin domain-containing protein n=1 Tax=Spirodela intermedia TaxID=51605 RepID=A0A7I8IYG9_SPIIN|nr:unnamed protein product [Spirodela intermedia]CAA6662849.1 unnamed protein product [Spirodela intermedia]